MKIIDYSNGIKVIKNYTTPEICQKLVTMINDEKARGRMFPWAEQENPNYIIKNPNPFGQTFIDKYVDDIIEFVNAPVKLVREQTNFTLWPVGCGRFAHMDNDVTSIWYSTILYLNDDYEAGEIKFPLLDLTIKPEVGDVVVFTPFAPKMRHEVIAPKGNSRYTLAVWLQSEKPFYQETK